MQQEMLLDITLVDSFIMQRNFKDQPSKPCRRFRYKVSGSPEALEQFTRDIKDGTNKGGLIHDTDGAMYYSWRTLLGTGKIRRSNKTGSWFIDSEFIDKLEALAEQSPNLMRSMGKDILAMLNGTTPKAESAKPEPAQEEEEEEEDLDK